MFTPLENYHFEKAKALHAGGHFAPAEKEYREVLASRPGDYRVLNNLGTLFEAQGRRTEAEWAYREALRDEPDSPVIHFNLAHVLQVDGRLDMAAASYERAAGLRPEHFGTWFNLGRVRSDLGQYEPAAEAFRRAAELDPESVAAASSLGSALYELTRLTEALEAFRRAVRLDPSQPSEHFNVGKTLEALGRRDEAAAAYKTSLSLNPDSEVTQENLGRILYGTGQVEEAIEFFRAWLRREPDNAVARHMLASISGEEVPGRASDGYVRKTFDSFADEFDAALARLEYRTPEALASLLRGRVEPEESWDVLDAGCGTGLCAPLFRPWAKTLRGVDLSGRMLEKARGRGLYDELVEAELTADLEARPASCDFILCADTLVYFGDLEPFFAGAHAALRPGGRLLFSVERLDGDPGTGGFRLNANGRYAHAPDYLRDRLAAAGFTVEALENAVLRREGGLPVTGMLVLARRAS